jgi:hypothetical protein
MAELNFGLLTPPGSQSIGNAFVQGMDQAAVARAQENQNALAQYTLGKAKREDELTNKMLAGMQSATTLEQQAAVLRSVGRYKDASDLINSDLTQQELRNKILAQPGDREKTELGNRAAKATFFATRLPTLSQNPDDAGVGRFLKEAVDAGVMSFEEASAKSADLLSKSLPERRLQMLQGGQSAKDALAALKPKFEEFSGGLYNVNEFDPNTGMPRFLSPRVAPPSTDAAIRSANAAGMKWNSETLQYENVGGGVPAQPGVAPAPVTPAAAPAPAGAPVTQAAFPRDTAVQQTTRMTDATAIKRQELANEQIKLADATQKLATPAAANDPNIRKFYEDQAKQATNNITSLNQELRVRTNNTPGAAATAAAPVVNSLPTAQPPAGAAPGSYSPKMLRDMTLKGMQPDGKGGQTFIPGGPKDPVVERQVANSRAAGAQTGKSDAIALEKLPTAISTGKELIRKLDALLGDANVVNGQVAYNTAPAAGFKTAFGPTGIIARAYPGSEASDFQSKVKEILGGAFLEAYETLRGAQGITDIEGKKATEARTRMGFDISQTEFITAAREYRKTAAEALAKSEARLNSLQRSAAPAGAPSLDVIFNPQRPQ